MNPPLQNLTAFTQRLIDTNSVTGQEKDVINLILNEMKTLGFERFWTDKNGSAIGMIEGQQPGPTLLLDGHCDTVDANPADWTRDPWKSEIVDNCLYGRGAADMKGSLATMIYAAASLDRSRLAGRIFVSATVAEETVEGGTLLNVINETKPDFVVIGEATRLNLNRGGRGRAEIKITTFGRPAHSSSPQAGHSAVADMVRVINTISGQPLPQDEFLGEGSIVLTDIISSPFPGRSVIPYECNVTYDRRLLPGETREAVLKALTNLPGLEDVKFKVEIKPNTETTYAGGKLPGDKFFPAWVIPEEHPLVQMAHKGLLSAGLTSSIGAYRFCTNAAYSAGTANIPTIGFGIGREEDAHIIDESIEVKDLASAFAGYQGIMYAVCSR